jgi:hypothetical protein
VRIFTADARRRGENLLDAGERRAQEWGGDWMAGTGSQPSRVDKVVADYQI